MKAQERNETNKPGRAPVFGSASPNQGRVPGAGARAPAVPVLLLSLLVLSSLSFADDLSFVPGGNLFAAQSAYGALIPLFIIGLATLSFVAALAFMVSQIFRSNEVMTAGKTEIYHAITTVLLGLFIFGTAVTLDHTLTLYCNDSAHACSGTLFDGAQAYINQVTCLSAMTSIKMEGYKMGLQYFAGMKSRFYAGAWGFSYPTYPGFEVLDRSMDLMQMFVIPFTSSLYVQKIGLDVIRATALTFLLPAGLLLRLFPPTRDAAGFLIASAFALYFILPFTYVMHKEIMEPMYLTEFGTPMCGGGASTNLVGLADQDLANSLALNLTPSPLGRDLLKFPTAISYVAVQSVFLPALSMIIVVTFIRTSTRFFAQGME
ncbi:Uncharacterised protein [uncultured archaeon]|nr:Uncharacterised protein [uncultured archaeon]